MGDIEATCEDIAIMNNGHILWKGTVSQLLDNARGKVFTVNISKNFLSQIKKNYIVTGMLVQSSYITVRLISDNPPDLQEAASAEPNVEDAYMYCLFSHGCDVSGGAE